MNDLNNIISEFSVKGSVSNIFSLGSGHIHKTFRVITSSVNDDDYVLQQMNTAVFKDLDAVMNNLEMVTAHIYQKLATTGDDLKRRVLTPVKLRQGGLVFTDNQNNTWRCFIYIPRHQIYDRAVSCEQVYEGGKSYGKFLQMLSDFPASRLKETIHNFHNMEMRMNQFSDACRFGKADRIRNSWYEIDLLKARMDEMLIIHRLGASGKIPLRVVHHDTKINNVLFDDHNKGLCVIDLDTVMPGYILDDFGDSIRTFTNTGEEDDAVTGNVSINMEYFESYASGFLQETNSWLTDIEKEHLALSAKAMTYMQALRFLTDCLNGDIYYQVHHSDHNLQRTRAQIKLLLSMEERYDEMKSIIKKLTSRN
jgi:thiamine kinase-like enzyme